MLSIFVLLCTCVPAQNIRVEKLPKEGGVNLRVTNAEACPISIVFDYELQNMRTELAGPDTLVVPAKSAKIVQSLVQLRPGEAYRYRYTYHYNYGDYRLKPDSSDHVYTLPYGLGKEVRIMQGYDGKFSHAGEAKLDFDLEPGSRVMAARGGTVIEAIDSFDRGCGKPKCAEYANYVTVLHDDGSWAAYIHLRHRGVVVRPGQVVKAGQQLGYSGNTGFSSKPHLHFEVYRQEMYRRVTLPTRFRVAGRERPVTLLENERYRAVSR